MANEEHFPRRLHGRTAAEVWQARAPISPEERRRFRDAVDQIRLPLAEELKSSLFEALPAADRASLDRKAVPQALQSPQVNGLKEKIPIIPRLSLG